MNTAQREASWNLKLETWNLELETRNLKQYKLI